MSRQDVAITQENVTEGRSDHSRRNVTEGKCFENVHEVLSFWRNVNAKRKPSRKSAILDESAFLLGCHRKHAIQISRLLLNANENAPGVIVIQSRMWNVDYPGAERLPPVETACLLVSHGHLAQGCCVWKRRIWLWGNGRKPGVVPMWRDWWPATRQNGFIVFPPAGEAQAGRESCCPAVLKESLASIRD